MTPTQRASTAKRYYPGRDGSALRARPLIHHAGGDALQNETYRSLGEELIAACAKGVAAEEVARLLEAGADPSFVHDSAGRAGAKGHLTPLLQAIRSDSAEKVKLLLAAGANTTRTERDTAYETACERSRTARHTVPCVFSYKSRKYIFL